MYLCYDVWTIISLYLDSKTFLNLLKVNKELNRLKLDINIIKNIQVSMRCHKTFKTCDNIYFNNIKIKRNTIINNISDKDMIKLIGIHALETEDNCGIGNKRLTYLKGIHTLKMLHNTEINDNGLEHLKGIHTLMLSSNYITNKGLEYLKGIHTLVLFGHNGVTDKGLEYLKGIHTLRLSYCDNITGEGFKHLPNIYKLTLTQCNQVTDKGLEYLKGIHILCLNKCDSITIKGIEKLEKVNTLGIMNCQNIINWEFEKYMVNYNNKLFEYWDSIKNNDDKLYMSWKKYVERIYKNDNGNSKFDIIPYLEKIIKNKEQEHLMLDEVDEYTYIKFNDIQIEEIVKLYKYMTCSI